MSESLFVCPLTGGPLEADWSSAEAGMRYPTLSGLPVLVPDPHAWLLRHGPWDPSLGLASHKREPMPIYAPDPVTPHLPPSALGAQGGFGAWLADVDAETPEKVCADAALDLAPKGPALDLGCEVGAMTRRMAMARNTVYAIDPCPEAVVLARNLLTGQLSDAYVPTHRRGCRRVGFPFEPVEIPVHFAYVQLDKPPFSAGSFAWVHLGEVVDRVGPGGLGELLVTATALVQRGGLLTVATSYDGPDPAIPEEPDPEDEFREALTELGLEVARDQRRVPRIRRRFDRHWTVEFVDCLALRRR